MAELWAPDYHVARFRTDGGGWEIQAVVEAWLREMLQHADEIPFPCQTKGVAPMLEVAAIRFLDEGGEILVNETDVRGNLVSWVGSDGQRRLARHWIRPPVPIPAALMKLALESELARD